MIDVLVLAIVVLGNIQTVVNSDVLLAGDSLIILIAAVVPSVAVLLLAICIVAAILCVIRSKNKVILGEQVWSGEEESNVHV